MDETTDVVAAALAIVRFFSHESCGECTPCREGTTWMQRILERIVRAPAAPPTWTCCSTWPTTSPPDWLASGDDHHLPSRPSATAPIVSVMRHFRPEVEARILRGAGPMADAVTLTVDGRPVQAPPGELLIAAAQRSGIYIPRFCWHHRMEPVGMCRMCLVEIEGPGAGPDHCLHHPGGGGMVVHTASDSEVCGRPRRGCWSTCWPTTRSTARCATGAGSARCRTRPWPTGRGRAAT